MGLSGMEALLVRSVPISTTLKESFQTGVTRWEPPDKTLVDGSRQHVIGAGNQKLLRHVRKVFSSLQL